MKLFAALRKMREFEKLQLPFIKSLIDFDIIIEIGYAQEQEKALTAKPLLLLAIGPVSTVRRRLKALIEQGIVTRITDANDRRAQVLNLSAASHKLLGRYGGVITGISVLA